MTQKVIITGEFPTGIGFTLTTEYLPEEWVEFVRQQAQDILLAAHCDELEVVITD